MCEDAFAQYFPQLLLNPLSRAKSLLQPICPHAGESKVPCVKANLWPRGC
jgi:hypothetical protein